MKIVRRMRDGRLFMASYPREWDSGLPADYLTFGNYFRSIDAPEEIWQPESITRTNEVEWEVINCSRLWLAVRRLLTAWKRPRDKIPLSEWQATRDAQNAPDKSVDDGGEGEVE